MAFYIWHRFDVGKEPWPDMGRDPGDSVISDAHKWQKIRLLKSKTDPFVPLRYATQLKAAKRCFQKHGVNIRNWTHAGRHAGCQLGEALEVPDAHLRKLGGWENSSKDTFYSSGVSITAARAYAEHGDKPGNYYLSREILEPPEELQRMIFPQLEETIERVYSVPVERRDKNAQGFILTLKWWRVVILQDAVVLSNIFPRSPIWTHHPFTTPLFRQFKQEALHAIDHDVHPLAFQIQQAVPAIATQIRANTRVMADGFSTQSNQHADELVMLEKGFQQVVQSLGQQKQMMQPMLDWITAGYASLDYLDKNGSSNLSRYSPTAV